MKKKFCGQIVYVLASMLVPGMLWAADGKSSASVAKVSELDEDFEDDVADEEVSKPPVAPRVAKAKSKQTAKKKKNVKVIEVNSVNFIKLKDAANEVFIPNPKVADVDVLNENSLYLTGLKPGITSLVVHNKKGEVLADYQIRVTYPLQEIKATIKSLHPDADVDITSMDDAVILKGRVASPEDARDIQSIVAHYVTAAKIINKLSIVTATQVLLKVKIAEVSRELNKSLGINWRAMSLSNSVNGSQAGFVMGNVTGFLEATSSMDDLKADLTGDNSIFSGNIQGGRWFIQAGGGSHVSALLDALASESFASVLAEPTLVALSGQTAKFTSGGEYGYTVAQSNSDSNTTEFKEWGTTLEFTPVVLSEDRIKINVKPEISTISSKTQDGTPSLTTKEAETTVELGSGQSLVIAGLLQTNRTATAFETPFLADIPLLGALFRNTSVSSTEKELVVIVTPYIVKPSSKALKLPTDMVPRMYSPLESIVTRKFHKNVKKCNPAGFSIK